MRDPATPPGNRRADRDRRRRARRGPTLGPVTISWRWEVGAPLFMIGVAIAALTVGVGSQGLVFWIGAGIAAVGAAVILQS